MRSFGDKRTRSLFARASPSLSLFISTSVSRLSCAREIAAFSESVRKSRGVCERFGEAPRYSINVELQVLSN